MINDEAVVYTHDGRQREGGKQQPEQTTTRQLLIENAATTATPAAAITVLRHLINDRADLSIRSYSGHTARSIAVLGNHTIASSMITLPPPRSSCA